LRARLYAVLWARADRCKVFAVVVFFEAVFEAVFAVTSCAMYALDQAGEDECLARRIRALLVVVAYRRLGSEFVVLIVSCGFGFPARVLAGFGTLMCGFGAVVETELPGVLSV
jgi:hypothetical protein